ncbi:DeoR family transcriptional regulator [Candidatus Dojkabacteria bacterium]|nr:DeoR family transcriptional regulator [Candidatus Dojkabacteria bacterium]
MNFSPTYTISNLILDYIVKIELSFEKISHTPLPGSHQSDLYMRNKAEDIHSLSQLIGNEIGYDFAMRVQKGQEVSGSNSKTTIFNNYRSTQDFVKSYERKHFLPPSAQLINHLNTLLMQGIVDDWELGKFRKFSEKPNEIYDTWYKYRENHPNVTPDAYLEEIMQWFVKPEVKIHKLIQIPIILFEFIDKAPLAAGNQITAITATSVLLKDQNYNPGNLLPTAKTISFLGSDLTEAFKLSRANSDKTIFIEAFLYSLSLEVLNLANEYSAIFDKKVVKKAELSLEFNDRQLKLLDYIKVHKKVTRREYAKLMGISFMTAYRDIQELLEKNYLTQKGVGRGTYYVQSQNHDTESALPVFGNSDEVDT